MTIQDLTFSYHFGKSDKTQRVSLPLISVNELTNNLIKLCIIYLKCPMEKTIPTCPA